jgi:DNA transposition AAA+ family ATPase
MFPLVRTRNIQRLFDMVEVLWAATSGEPRMGLIFGPAGRGKTRAVDLLATQTGAAFVSVARVFTPNSLLRAICRELGVPPAWSAAENLARAAEGLRGRSNSEALGRGLLILDEADYLVKGINPPNTPPLLDTVRDLHDLSGAPILLVGMDGLARAMSAFPQFWDRILVCEEFGPINASEIEKMGREIAALEVPTPVAEDIARVTGGNIRQTALYLMRLARVAKAKKTNLVDREWVIAVEAEVTKRKQRAAQGSGLRRIK